MIATNIVLNAQVKREHFKPFSSTNSSCHKTFASYLALTVLHKTIAKITWESKLRGKKSKIIITIARPARANNNCWLLLLEDNSNAGTERCRAPSKHRAICSVDILVFPPLLSPYMFSFTSLWLAPQTINQTGQELFFIYMCSTFLNYSKIDDCGPSILLHLCSDTNKAENLNFVSSLLQQFTKPDSSLGSQYIFPGSGPCCPEYHQTAH